MLHASGHAEDVIAVHGVLEPGLHFIGKPFTPERLERKLSEVLGQA